MTIEYRLEHIEQDLIEHERKGVKFGTYSNEAIREIVYALNFFKNENARNFNLKESYHLEKEQFKAEIEHILGEVRWYAGKDNYYTIQQSLKEFREGKNK